MMRFLVLLILTPLLALAELPGWLGVYYDPVAPIPQLESDFDHDALLGAASGLRLSVVFPDSPAELGGLLPGDLIFAIDGEPFKVPADQIRQDFRARMDGRAVGEKVRFHLVRDALDRELSGGEKTFWDDPETYLESMPNGSELSATVIKEQRVFDVVLALGPRPEANWPAPRPNDEIYPPARFPPVILEAITDSLAGREGVAADRADLLERLAATQNTADPFRLDPVIYAMREPFRMGSLTHYYQVRARNCYSAKTTLDLASTWMDSQPHRPIPTRQLPRNFEELLKDIRSTLERAGDEVDRAFQNLSQEDRDFLLEQRWVLPKVFAEDIYIHFDEDRDRFRRNQRILKLAEQVDQSSLQVAAQIASSLQGDGWIAAAEKIVRDHFADELHQAVLHEEVAAPGRILIGGEGAHWYREKDYAFILDLAGDDFYTGNAGANSAWDVPVSLCIDLAGDDAYESSTPCNQGAGSLGVGGLLDRAGNDRYTGIQFCQGTGYLGIGWLADMSGHDRFRGRSFCQGVGLFGAGVIIEAEGDDRYEGDVHVQACGLAGGVGLIFDHLGNDEYYAKGLYPTGYGDEGIFDAWSQGSATGFRTLASGGMALLYDGGGEDLMEAGNFSQGGGYYHGWGILFAGGNENDRYIGSRYNQGFAAHQALGSFIEVGGDDLYQTRQGVAQGLAWDECATLFIDSKGDDRYEGGTFFSQGASAHNSLCVFLDGGGRDHYLYAPGPARAGTNDYHGGTSLSLFIDEKGRDNVYQLWDAPAGGYGYQPEHGFWLDLEGSLAGALEELQP